MGERDWLEERFEGHRRRLQVVAYRILGSWSEAEDAVQETWLRLNRSGTNGIEELERWLTTWVGCVAVRPVACAESRPEVRQPRLASGIVEPAPTAPRPTERWSGST